MYNFHLYQIFQTLANVFFSRSKSPSFEKKKKRISNRIFHSFSQTIEIKIRVIPPVYPRYFKTEKKKKIAHEKTCKKGKKKKAYSYVSSCSSTTP